MSSRFRAMRIRAYVVKGARSVITANWVIQMVAKGACMAVSISIQMGEECFGGRIMQRILKSVSDPRRFLQMLLVAAGCEMEWMYLYILMRLIISISENG